jgi:hypothetical protein
MIPNIDIKKIAVYLLRFIFLFLNRENVPRLPDGPLRPQSEATKQAFPGRRLVCGNFLS